MRVGETKCGLRLRGRGLRLSASAVVAASLAGCALTQRAEAPRETYDISAPDTVSGTGRTRAQILVKAPTALKAIDSDRIVVRPSANVITYLSGAQWQDAVPRLFQVKLLETFQNTGSTGATALPGDGLVIDYQLVIEVRRFGIDTQGAPRAVLETSIKLLTDRSGQVRESRIFTATAPAGAPPEGYVQAIDAAFDEMARDIVRWVIAST